MTHTWTKRTDEEIQAEIEEHKDYHDMVDDVRRNLIKECSKYYGKHYWEISPKEISDFIDLKLIEPRHNIKIEEI